MNSYLEKAYFGSPVLVQNALVSLYGLKLLRERYNGKSVGYLDALSKSERYSAEQMKEYQTQVFLDLARYSIKKVPFYRSWSISQCFSGQDITSLDSLSLFPILKKETIRSDPTQFISDDYKDKRNLLKLSTSGTTGAPLDIYCDPDTRTHHYAFFSRLRRWFGLEPRSRRATLFGRIILLPEQDEPPFWRYDLAQNNLLMSSYHLSDKNIKYYYLKLCKYRPDEIIAYPSSLYQVAQYINANSLEPLKLKVVITTAETLLDYQRASISAAFNAPLVDQYGCTEMALFASNCEQGVMHVHPEHGIVETVDSKGSNVFGVPGSLLATGFVNRVMPLIRYEIGDQVTLDESTSRCACGRDFPVIKALEGRVDDLLYRLDGTPVGRLDPVFKGGGHIEAAKIIQSETGDVEVLLQPSPDFSESDKGWLEGELRKRLGADIGLSIVLVPEVPKEKNGKFKAVESNYRV